ncbi:MAG: pilus assembly protein PilM [Chitinispirillaceae bacterium]|nr:pilus assembly protein PilM [Chitinispirillaceae bacterium]
MKSCCGLDLQRDYLSVVLYFADRNAAEPVVLKPLSITTGPQESVWSVWEDEFRSIKGQLKHITSSISCSIPADYAVVKICAVDANEESVREVIEWELSQQIVGSIDDFVFDFQELPDGGASAEKRYLVAAYRREYVDRLAGMVRRVKLEPRVIDLDIFGLVNAFEANYPEKRGELALLAHCENLMTKLVLTARGTLLDYHCFEHAAGFMDPAGYASMLENEISRFLSTSHEASQGTVGGTYITGSFMKLAENRSAILGNMNSVEMLNPFRKIKCQLEGIEEKQMLEYSTQLAVSIGLVLRSE